MPNIKLRSSDNEIFDIDVQIAKCSGTIKTMLEDCGMEDNNNAVVPLPNVNSVTLRKILDWAEYHQDDPQRTEEDEEKAKKTDHILPWDADFLKMDQGALFELILVANYLDIKPLLDIACKTIANMIKGKTPADIRQTFNIKNDFTATEKMDILEAKRMVCYYFTAIKTYLYTSTCNKNKKLLEGRWTDCSALNED
uniref:S-phase kinase-associated protein 1 n=1 Tax=Glossina palpalis gambiensis TaxID=67801 RepID=A0A1B0B7H0_9MUSC